MLEVGEIGSLEPIKLVAELEVKVVSWSYVSVVRNEGLLGRNRKREKESKK